MTGKKLNPVQMQRCLDVLEQLAQSGLSTQDFAQTQGIVAADRKLSHL